MPGHFAFESWMNRLAVLLAFTAVTAIAGDALAQAYPARQARVLVGSAPGSVSDLAARIVMPRLSESLGQQFIVENRPGGTGVIAATAMINSAPDGYTLYAGNSADMTVNPVLAAKLPYDSLADFLPIVAISYTPVTIAVHPGVQARDLRELIALAKAKPGVLAYASAGNGTVNHIVGEWFKSLAGINMIHVPYKGGGASVPDVVAGVVPVGMIAVSVVTPHESVGRLRVLGVSSEKRLAFKPDWPTIAEAGFPGFDASVWVGLFAPVATSRDIVLRLNLEVNRLLRQPEVRDRFHGQGAELLGGTPEDLGARVRADLQRYTRLVREFGIRAE